MKSHDQENETLPSFIEDLVDGTTCVEQEDYQSAILLLLPAYDYFKKEQDRLNTVKTALQLGISYLESGEPETAKTYLEDASNTAKEITGEDFLKAELLYSLAKTYHNLHNNKAAYDCLKKVIFIVEQNNLSDQETANAFKIQAHLLLGQWLKETMLYDEAARDHLQQAFDCLPAESKEWPDYFSPSEIAFIFFKKNNFSQAEALLRLTLSNSGEEKEAPQDYEETQMNLLCGIALLKQEKYEESRPFLLKAFAAPAGKTCLKVKTISALALYLLEKKNPRYPVDPYLEVVLENLKALLVNRGEDPKMFLIDVLLKDERALIHSDTNLSKLYQSYHEHDRIFDTALPCIQQNRADIQKASVVICYPNELIELADGIKKSDTLKELNIIYTTSYNTFDDDVEEIKSSCKTAETAADQLTMGLAHNRSITHLTLNNFSQRGLAAVSSSLETNKTLTFLVISSAQEAGQGERHRDALPHLLAGLQKNSSIQSLVIDSQLGGPNPSSFPAVSALVNTLEKNEALRSLSLIHTGLSITECKRIGQALTKNRLNDLSLINCSSEKLNGTASLLNALSEEKLDKLHTLTVYQTCETVSDRVAIITALTRLLRTSAIKDLYIVLPGGKISDGDDPQVVAAIGLLAKAIQDNPHIVNIKQLELVSLVKSGSVLESSLQKIQDHAKRNQEKGNRGNSPKRKKMEPEESKITENRTTGVSTKKQKQATEERLTEKNSKQRSSLLSHHFLSMSNQSPQLPKRSENGRKNRQD